jgi:transcriptional regulator with XRE-family HTH domain
MAEYVEREALPFHIRVRQLLLKKGVSQNTMEKETGICRRIVYPLKHRPTRALLMALAYYFGITVEELVDGTDAYNDWYRIWEE